MKLFNMARLRAKTKVKSRCLRDFLFADDAAQQINSWQSTQKVQVYKACILSTLLYGSETWVQHASYEKRLNVFHMRPLRHIMGITWNNSILERAQLPCMFAILNQWRMGWIGHVMENWRKEPDREADLNSDSRTSVNETWRPCTRFRKVKQSQGRQHGIVRCSFGAEQILLLDTQDIVGAQFDSRG